MMIFSEATLNIYRAAGPCENCGQWCDRRDPHHVWPKGIGAANQLDIAINLMGLERRCHDLYPGILTRVKCLGIVAAREGCEVQEIIDTVYFLRRLPKGATRRVVSASVGELTAGAQRLAWKSLEGHLQEEAA